MRRGGAVAAGHKAVLLDALGTLVDLEPPGPALVGALERGLGIRVTLEDAERAIAAEMRYYRAHLDEGRDPVSLGALRRRCAAVLGEALAPTAGSAELDGEQLTAALMESLHFRAYPDAAPALAALRESGARLVVVSNWDVSLPEVLDRVGLARGVDAVVTSAGVGARKPSREIFRAGLEAAGASAGEVIHVGDGIEEDVAGAQAAGIEPVLIVREGARPAGVGVRARPAGVRIIRRLTELV